MRTLEITIAALLACLLATGCATREQAYSIDYHPQTTPAGGAGNAATVSSNTVSGYSSASGHLYTEAPRSSLTPVSSNSASRIYSEPTNDSQALTEAAAKSSLLNEDNPWNPQDQASTDSDRAIVRHIRQSVREDYVLSTVAPDLKIAAKDGQVTLGGAVKNENEKKRLDALAQKTTGVVNVQDQMTVKPD